MQDEVDAMKQTYSSPLLEWILIGADDFLTISDNDAPFLPPVGSEDDGWSGYH